MTTIRDIVDGGYCVGCGGCVTAHGFNGRMHLDELGMYKPSIIDQEKTVNDEASKICPFSDEGGDENTISEALYRDGSNFAEEIGFYKALYVGSVASENFRKIGSSGGAITWLLSNLIISQKVDYVIHVKESKSEGVLFRYDISSTVDEVKNGAKSRYYPIELSEVIDRVRRQPGRYAIVGLPCFVKSVRRLAKVDPIVEKRIVFCIGLVCGHLKSAGFAESLSWQLGVEPEQVRSIDYRVKMPGFPASSYGLKVFLKNDKVVHKEEPAKNFIGGNWGHNFFRNPACNYCDDVFSETADVCVGDAWLPQYVQDSLGTSIVVVRNDEINQLIREGIKRGDLTFDVISEADIIASQAGGLRDRREGLAYRLLRKKRSGTWAPRKRVKPSDKGLTTRRKKIYEIREQASNESHLVWLETKKSGDFSIFRKYFDGFDKKHRNLNLSIYTWIRNKVRSVKKVVFG